MFLNLWFFRFSGVRADFCHWTRYKLLFLTGTQLMWVSKRCVRMTWKGVYYKIDGSVVFVFLVLKSSYESSFYFIFIFRPHKSVPVQVCIYGHGMETGELYRYPAGQRCETGQIRGCGNRFVNEGLEVTRDAWRRKNRYCRILGIFINVRSPCTCTRPSQTFALYYYFLFVYMFRYVHVVEGWPDSWYPEILSPGKLIPGRVDPLDTWPLGHLTLLTLEPPKEYLRCTSSLATFAERIYDTITTFYIIIFAGVLRGNPLRKYFLYNNNAMSPKDCGEFQSLYPLFTRYNRNNHLVECPSPRDQLSGDQVSGGSSISESTIGGSSVVESV